VALGDHLWWGGNFNELMEKHKSGLLDIANFRFFLGYSGWEEGQLSDELLENTWIVCDNSHSKKIFKVAPDELWRAILKNMGGDFQVLANYPIDPRLN
jgi:putative transcriptional regulator